MNYILKSSFISFILFLLLFNSGNVFSQETSDIAVCTKGSEEYTIRYNKLLAMFEERGKSPSYQEYIALEKIFDDKANFQGTKREMIRNQEKRLNGVHEWVRNNIETTDFKNCDEAEVEIAKLLKMQRQVFRENMDLFQYFAESTKVCQELLFELLLELNRKYGPDFMAF